MSAGCPHVAQRSRARVITLMRTERRLDAYQLRHVGIASHLDDKHRGAGRIIETFLERCAGMVIETAKGRAQSTLDTSCSADAIIAILLRHDFHSQSRGRVAHLLPDVHKRIARSLAQGRPLPFYLLYNGGYRAPADPADGMIFHTDTTELLLLYQIARLQRAVQAIYAPGVVFHIVINDAVTAYTNDIPYVRTAEYSRTFRAAVDMLNAGAMVRLLVQSELGSFEDRMRGIAIDATIDCDARTHFLVERFLGRSCSWAEARERAARYVAAEAVWGMQVGKIIARDTGICMRQVAHPACISFRPFPGSSIRVQNGSIGFCLRENRDPLPFLVTSRTPQDRVLPVAPVRLDHILSVAGK